MASRAEAALIPSPIVSVTFLAGQKSLGREGEREGETGWLVGIQADGARGSAPI